MATRGFVRPPAAAVGECLPPGRDLTDNRHVLQIGPNPWVTPEVWHEQMLQR